MPEQHRLYLDQMFGLDVAQTLQIEGYDMLRASETSLLVPTIIKSYKKQFLKTALLSHLMSILVTG